jgi:RNA polymerase sigma factor (TIGR02999 family)
MAGDITELLLRTSAGDKDAEAELVPLIYAELSRRAAYHMSRERPDHTLQATALVNEVYLRVFDQHQTWQNREHFFGVAAHLMRCILVDHARAHRAQRRGGGLKKISLESLSPPLLYAEEQYDGLLALDEALNKLAALDSRVARVVELRFFCDLSFAEIGLNLNLSEKTARNDWSFAQTWLYGELTKEAE